MPDFLTGKLWKFGAIGGALVSLVLGGLLIAAKIEIGVLEDDKKELSDSINNPVTGYAARLQQSNANVAVLKAAVVDQNQKLEALAVQSARDLERTRREIALVKRENRELQGTVDDFLAQPVAGDTLGDRIMDVDRRAIEEFIDVEE